MQSVTGNRNALKTFAADQLAGASEKAFFVEVAHRAHFEPVRVEGGDFLEIFVLNAIDEFLDDNGAGDSGVIHIGKKDLGGVAAVNHERRQHLDFLSEEIGPSVMQGLYGLAINDGVLLQPKMRMCIDYCHEFFRLHKVSLVLRFNTFC